MAALLGGLGGLFGLDVINHPSNALTLEQHSKPVTTQPASIALDLSSPDDNLLVSSPNLLIQGSTSPNAIVILSLDTGDQVLPVSSSGDFSTTIKLDKGLNQFIIAASDYSANLKSVTRTVYYTTSQQ